MSRNPRLRRTISVRRRPRVPPVPTFQPEPEAKPDEPVQAAAEPDAAEEVVRRMVEAAYT